MDNQESLNTDQKLELVKTIYQSEFVSKASNGYSLKEVKEHYEQAVNLIEKHHSQSDR